MYSVKTRISDFLDYRVYLSAVETELRNKGEFSHRRWNRDCGFSSPNFLQLVVQGKRKLSPSAADGVIQALQLSKEEGKLFKKMITANDEIDQIRKLGFVEELLKDPIYSQAHSLNQTEMAFYSRWYNIVLRELLQTQPHLTPAELAICVIPSLCLSQVEESLAQMSELGLIQKSDQGWRVLHKSIRTPNSLFHLALKEFHREMLERAKESLQRFSASEREVSSLTLNLTPAQFLELQLKIRQFKSELLAAEAPAAGAQVYQVGFQVFPLTQKTSQGDLPS